MASLELASTDFALNLLRKLSEGSEENLFLSPASISLALAMTYGGADGRTKAEMEEVLFAGLKDSVVHDGFAELVKALNPTSDAYALHTANRLYAQEDFEFKKDFLDLCSNAYQSSLEAVDFKSNADAIRLVINEWVEGVTKERIKDLIAPGILNALTRLVLVNAIYFKGTWASQFRKEATRKETFHVSPERQIQVDMMHQKAKFGYTEDGKVQVLRMDYEGSDNLAMFVFLPKERFGLETWLGSVDGGGLSKLMESCRREEVVVSLPKWRMETSFSLNDALKALGMKDAFHEDRANFAQMIGGDLDRNRLHISAVIHKAFIEVDEEGSEAAAATAVVMARNCIMIEPRPPKEFEADQAIYFVITKGGRSKNSLPLFQGCLRQL